MRYSFRWPCMAAAAFGFAWFLAIGGGPTLNPLDVHWVLSGDLTQHWFGFLFFQGSPWTLPLGSIRELLYPVGTNIAFTDSNPLLAIALKPFAPWMPAEYQVMGLWLAACFALQGYLGAKLAGVVTADARQQALGGMLFVLSVPLIGRLGHDTLCAQWLILAMLYLGFRDTPDSRTAERTVWLVATIVAIASATHPYLAAMCWLLGLSVYVRLWRSGRLPWSRAAIAGIIISAVTIAIFSAIGYFGTVDYGMGGFGMFSADLLTLVNPDKFSRFFPPMPTHPGQYEGAAYLGLGGMLAGLAGIVMLFRQRLGPRHIWPIVTASMLMAVFSLSNIISYQGQIVLSLQSLYSPFESLVTPFRSSGRFVWPIYYVVILFGIWGLTRVFGDRRRTLATALTAAVVVVQAVELRSDPLAFAGNELAAPVDFGETSTAAFRHLALFPMEVAGECKPFNPRRTYQYMWLAKRRNLTFNSGRFARLSPAAVQAACAQLERAVDTASLDAETIYVLSSGQHLDRFARAGATCGTFAGDWICVTQDSDPEFRRRIGSRK